MGCVGMGRHRRARRMCRRRRTTDLPRCTRHRIMATTRSPNCWWYVQRGEEGENVRMCRIRGSWGGGRMSGIDIHLYRYLYGYVGIFLSLYRMNIYTDMFTWTYPSFCVDTFVYIYPYVFSTDSIRYISFAAVWEGSCGDTKEIVYMCVCKSLYRYLYFCLHMHDAHICISLSICLSLSL